MNAKQNEQIIAQYPWEAFEVTIYRVGGPFARPTVRVRATDTRTGQVYNPPDSFSTEEAAATFAARALIGRSVAPEQYTPFVPHVIEFPSAPQGDTPAENPQAAKQAELARKRGTQERPRNAELDALVKNLQELKARADGLQVAPPTATAPAATAAGTKNQK